MKVLFDTNILLDVFLKRESFYYKSVQLIAFAEEGKIEGWLCSTTVTTLYYLLSKELNRKKADVHINNLLKIFHVARVDRAVLAGATDSNFTDFEDAVLYQSAVHSRLDAILTRNQKDFKESELPVYTPVQFINVLKSLEQ